MSNAFEYFVYNYSIFIILYLQTGTMYRTNWILEEKKTKNKTTSTGFKDCKAFSVPLNIAEGSGKFSKPDRKNYFTTARASVFECIAILDILRDQGIITSEEFNSK